MLIPASTGFWSGSTTLKAYLEEDGTGSQWEHHVDDLTPSPGMKLNLVIILESPHQEELARKLPMSGKAGRDALRFLTTQAPATEALGPFVNAVNQRRNGAGIALVNVSSVPLEESAFLGRALKPGLSAADWELLDRLRKATPRQVSTMRAGLGNESAKLLLTGFQSRVTSLGSLSDATVAVAGTFAQLYWRSIHPTSVAQLLEVPHPSLHQWNRPTNQDHKDLVALRQVFNSLIFGI